MDSMPKSGSSSLNDANRHRRRRAQEARVFSPDASSSRARDRNLRGLGLNPSSWLEQASTSKIFHSSQLAPTDEIFMLSVPLAASPLGPLEDGSSESKLVSDTESIHQTSQDGRNLERLKIPEISMFMSLEAQEIIQEIPENISKTNEDIQKNIICKAIDEKNAILRENNEMRDTIHRINNENEALMHMIDELKSRMRSSEELQKIKQKIDQDTQNDKDMLRMIGQQYQTLQDDNQILQHKKHVLQDKLTNNEQENLILQIKNKELQYDNRALRCEKQTLNIKNQILQSEKQALQSENQKLQDRIGNIDQEKKAIQREKQILQREEQKLHNREISIYRERQVLQIDKQTLQYEKQKLQNDKQGLQNIINDIQRENQRLKNVCEGLQSKMQKMDQHKQQSTVPDGASSFHEEGSSSQPTGRERMTHHLELQLQEHLRALGFKLHDNKLSNNYSLAKFLLTEQGKAWLNIYSKRWLKSDKGEMA